MLMVVPTIVPNKDGVSVLATNSRTLVSSPQMNGYPAHAPITCFLSTQLTLDLRFSFSRIKVCGPKPLKTGVFVPKLA